VTQKEKLEVEAERFPEMADTVGLMLPTARLPMDDARHFAYELMNCPSAEEARKLMVAKRGGAQAFWQVLDLVMVRARADRVRPGVPPLRASGPLAVVACTVLEYCETMDAQHSDDF